MARPRVGKGLGDTVQISSFTDRMIEGKEGEISCPGSRRGQSPARTRTQDSSYPPGAVDPTMTSGYNITDVKGAMIKSRVLFRIRLTYKKDSLNHGFCWYLYKILCFPL